MIKRLVIIMLLVFALSGVYANDLGDKLRDFSGDNAKMYLQPLVNTIGAALNSSSFTTAKVLDPFLPSLKVSAIIVPISNSYMTFMAVPPDYDGWEGEVPVETATVFGKKGNRLGNEEIGFYMPDGFDITTAVLPHASLSLGLPFGNELMIRYLPRVDVPVDMGKKLTFWGVGLKHSIDQHLPNIIPIHLAVQGIYQSLKISDLIDVETLVFNTHVSKNIAMLTFYGGLGWENTKLEARYTYEQRIEVEIEYEGETISVLETHEIPMVLKMEAENSFKTTLGLRINFWAMNVFADYSVANNNSFNVGFGIEF